MDVNHDGFVNVLDIVKEVAELNDPQPEAQYSLVPTDSSDVPLTGPISVGDTFYVDVYVQDLRSVSNPGIAGGDVDVTYAAQGRRCRRRIANGSYYSGPELPCSHHGGTRRCHQHTGYCAGRSGQRGFERHGQSVLLHPAGQRRRSAGSHPDDGQRRRNRPVRHAILGGEATVSAVDAVNGIPGQIANNLILPGSASVTITNAQQTPASLTGSVYLDANNDNSQDNGELGQQGVTVQLIDASNTVVDSITTGPTGIFSFTNITPGTYSIHEVQPTGLYETGLTVGSVGGPAVGTASGLDTVTGITLSSGNVAAGYGFAVQLPGTISGREYVDANANNIYDTGEAGLGGVTIQLSGPNNSTATTTTAADGTYSFTNLIPGSYSVHEVTPSGAAETAANLGSAGGTVSGVDTINGIALTSGTNASGYNFATQNLASLSGTEYVDSNSNNVFDSGDSGLQGVTINLLNSSNVVVASQVTDISGHYSFTALPAGTYSIQEVAPASPYVESAANAGTASGTPIGFGSITSVALAAGVNATGYNFGVTNPTAASAQYLLVPTDASDTPITGSIIVGQTFYVDVMVQDLRSVTYAGIASGNVDMAYVAQGGGTAGASPTGNVIPGVNYPVPTQASHGNALTTPGLVSNLQGSETLNTTGDPFYYTPLGSGARFWIASR